MFYSERGDASGNYLIRAIIFHYIFEEPLKFLMLSCLLARTYPNTRKIISSPIQLFNILTGAVVAQWGKRWPTDLADRVRSPLEAKSSQP